MTADWKPTGTGLHDWALACLVTVPGGAVPLFDGQRVTVDEFDQLRGPWRDAWIDVDLANRDSDAPGAQRISAYMSRLARENPHGLDAHLHAGLQRHAAGVADNARAEYCRHLGGTGIERLLIDDAVVTFTDADGHLNCRTLTFAEARDVVAYMDQLHGPRPDPDCGCASCGKRHWAHIAGRACERYVAKVAS